VILKMGDFVMLETTNHEGNIIKYKFPKILYLILKRIKFRVVNKLDGLIVIDGPVGSGKSSLGHGISGTWEQQFNRRHTIDNVQFMVESVVKFTDMENNETHVCQFDESIQGGSGRDVITKGGHMLKITLITKRRKRHLFLFIVDNIKELSSKIIERANLYINVQYRESPESIVKGVTRIFSCREAKQIWGMYKNAQNNKMILDKIKKKINSRKPVTVPNYSDIWFTEKEYDKKKIKETKILLENTDKRVVQRDKAIMFALSLGATQQKIATAIGLTRSTIADIKAKMTSLE